MLPHLELIVEQSDYGDLPETWQVPRDTLFSTEKKLYDYQTDAVRKAAQALYLYYQGADNERLRKENFSARYNKEDACLAVPQYESRTARRDGRENTIFSTLSEYFKVQGDEIPAREFINRMSFWMATGSGKTLVMVKLIEYLHSLMAHKEIPERNILLLAPRDYLLEQIRRTVAEFNESGTNKLHIALVHLRDQHRTQQREVLGKKTVTVYYHRSDNIADVQKDAKTNYKDYENDGKWYVLLDEAHKGGKENSKRQAYYSILARQGFLFNFSATFTDEADIVTTVKKYNLENFVKAGYGKNIYLNEDEYKTFRDKGEEASPVDRKKIVLKSLLTFAYISSCSKELREKTGLGEALYHRPLMLTLVNSVNTDTDKNDLWAFFETLRELAANQVDKVLFEEAKKELAVAWRSAKLMFGQKAKMDTTALRRMTPEGLRLAFFRSRSAGALQYVCGKGKGELAFQLKNSDSPFALMRIGDTTKWRKELLQGYEESSTLKETSYFDSLSTEDSPITILMGSRAFFESWDSNRPNVINYINIGGQDAKKFVVQSVGRGVRIQTLPGAGGRRRLSHLLRKGGNLNDTERLIAYKDAVHPVETLFLFATNRKAIAQVLDGLDGEKSGEFHELKGFEKATLPKVAGEDMPLFVPQYTTEARGKASAPFSLSRESLTRLEEWLKNTSDSVLMVRDGLTAEEIKGLRDMLADKAEKFWYSLKKSYVSLPFLQERLLSHLSAIPRLTDGIRTLKETDSEDDDIVHFRHIRVRAGYVGELQTKVAQVKEGRISDEEVVKLAQLLTQKKITREKFDSKTAGQDEIDFRDGELTIQTLANHYYLPVITGEEKVDYIQHIIKVPSEVRFIASLKAYLDIDTGWDAWMFSKLDESLDKIDIPYYDKEKNQYRRFIPDFIFWLCNSEKKIYHIVFVDPKGTAFTINPYAKIDGYKALFCEGNAVRTFEHKGWNVSVRLLYYNEEHQFDEAYGEYWTSDPAEIFKQA